MLQAANTDHLNPLVPKAHNSECQNLLFPLQVKPIKLSQVKSIKSSLRIYIFYTFRTNGLMFRIRFLKGYLP